MTPEEFEKRMRAAHDDGGTHDCKPSGVFDWGGHRGVVWVWVGVHAGRECCEGAGGA
jgi:hypothetical protein